MKNLEENDFLKINESYKNEIHENVKEYSKINLESITILKLKEWLKKTSIHVILGDKDFDVIEKFVALNKTTWLKVKEAILFIYCKPDFEELFDNLTLRFGFVLDKMFNEIIGDINETISKIEGAFEYKKEYDSVSLTSAIFIESLMDGIVTDAYIEVVSWIYKSVVKYLLKNSKVNIKNISIEKHVGYCFDIFGRNIEESIKKFKRTITSWLYEWDNLYTVLGEYVVSKNIQELAKTFSKIFDKDYF